MRDTDRGDPRASGGGLAVQVRAHQLEFAADIVLAEPDPRDVVLRGERRHGLPEPVADLFEQRRRRKRIPQMIGEERDHLR
ncbi:hypothetical protein [Amycolatopsis panacis]|uniref:hypothetical protein n=1 Tax=Amycolatopsis panacis TaxID=2340917 RepID=UPI0018F53DE0|nr:hypothetical protein [Amycolatopsis panacis]